MIDRIINGLIDDIHHRPTYGWMADRTSAAQERILIELRDKIHADPEFQSNAEYVDWLENVCAIATGVAWAALPGPSRDGVALYQIPARQIDNLKAVL